jgi:TonB family protein
LIRNISKIISYAKGKSCVNYKTAKLILTETKSTPHSFWKYIFVNKEDYINGNIPDEIIIHEYEHIKQKHSIDIIFIELLIAFFWFNPILYLYRKKIKQNHEFIADNAVVKSKQNVSYYQALLINNTYKRTSIELVSKFNSYLTTKNRFIMMTKTTSKLRSICARFALIPAMFVAICVFSSKTIAQNVNNILPQQKSGNVASDSTKNSESVKQNNNSSAEISVKDENVPFAVVDEKPKFQGGDYNEFTKWVNSKIKYPEAAIKDSIQGRIIVQFVIDKSGNMKNVNIIKKVHPALDAEALSVIRSSPAWTPGKQKNKPVDVLFQFPVVFKL